MDMSDQTAHDLPHPRVGLWSHSLNDMLGEVWIESRVSCHTVAIGIATRRHLARRSRDLIWKVGYRLDAWRGCEDVKRCFLTLP